MSALAADVTTERITRLYGGKEYCITVTTYEGTGTYRTGDGREILADAAIHYDYGPKLGEGWDYILHRDCAPGQRAEGRRRIRQAAAQALLDGGLW